MGWVVDKVSGPLVAGICIALFGGWFIAQINERYKSRRDLYFKSVDSLRAQLEETIQVSYDYWSSPQKPESVAKEAKLEFLFSDINDLTRVCAGALWKKDDDVGPLLVGRLAIAIFGNPHYRVANRLADSQQAAQVALAATKLASFVTEARASYFHRSAWVDLRQRAAGLLRLIGRSIARFHRTLVLLVLVALAIAACFGLASEG